MGLLNGQTVQEGDFITASTGSSDSGKVIKLNADGRISVSALFSFGDGSDGDATISSPTTLTRNMYYNNLTVNSTLTTDGYQIFVKGTLSGNGTIDWGTANNGATPANPTSNTAIAGGAGGAQSGGGPLKNVAGAQGGTASNGGTGGGGSSTATSQSPCVGSAPSAGGTGGTGDNGSPGTGVAGTISLFRKFGIITSEVFSCLSPDSNNLLVVPKPQGQAAGGGSGCGDNSFSGSGCAGSGGGGGASGGIIYIAANTWAGTFTIKSTGGNGGNGANGYFTVNASTGGGGGGAGGNGGVAIVIYGTKTWTGSYNLAGGTAGTGGNGTNAGGAGASGTNGVAGTSYEIGS